MLFPHELDATKLERTLSLLGLEMVLFDPAAGDWKGGERGLMCLPDREDEFLESVRSALVLARRLGTRNINILAGIPDASTRDEVTQETLLRNLRQSAELAAERGVAVLVENINQVDVPGYSINTVDKAVSIIKAAGHSNIGLQLDQYHASMSGEDPVEALRENFGLIAHVQIADTPGRHEPGTGSAPIQRFLAELDEAAYAGFVGLEYRPLGSTDEGLGWIKALGSSASA
jgi:hydroxypyruvate isomerase